jgi:hypothetical protein
LKLFNQRIKKKESKSRKSLLDLWDATKETAICTVGLKKEEKKEK